MKLLIMPSGEVIFRLMNQLHNGKVEVLSYVKDVSNFSLSDFGNLADIAQLIVDKKVENMKELYDFLNAENNNK